MACCLAATRNGNLGVGRASDDALCEHVPRPKCDVPHFLIQPRLVVAEPEDLRGGKAGQGRVGHEPDQTAAAAEDKIEPELVENMRSWEHTGFSVDQSVRLPAGDQTGIERLIQYTTRSPFSSSRLVKVTETGQVIDKAEKSSCGSFPEATGDGMQAGPKRN